MTESIIIDNGTNTIKAGFSDDDMPRVVIPTVLGKPFFISFLWEFDLLVFKFTIFLLSS